MKALSQRPQRRNGLDRRSNLWDQIWKNRQGKVVVYQQPNIWIIGWAILATVSLFVPTGGPEDVVWGLSSALLIIWALLEIVQGVNYFRRALGVVILCASIASLFSLGL